VSPKKERETLISSLITWKLRDPTITLFIGEREVVIEQELAERRKKPDLPRVYGTLFDYKDRKPRHTIYERQDAK